MADMLVNWTKFSVFESGVTLCLVMLSCIVKGLSVFN